MTPELFLLYSPIGFLIAGFAMIFYLQQMGRSFTYKLVVFLVFLGLAAYASRTAVSVLASAEEEAES